MKEISHDKVVGKVAWRIVPFLVITYLLCFIDRVNVGFAALTMNADLGMSPTVYGVGAGIMFISYFLCGLPSNLLLHRIGARRWIAWLMIVWGLISACTALVTGSTSFLILRFLLGAAEAGFFPGVILYMTHWFPAENRAVMSSRFMFAMPIALSIGSILSGWILQMDGVMGLAGWKWLFIIEGLPASLLGAVCFWFLTEKPKEAKWLSPAERDWLQGKLDAEVARTEAVHKTNLWESIIGGRVLLLGALYFIIVTGFYGINMWLPQIVNAFGHLATWQVGLISAIPFLAAAIGMLVIGASSDRKGERTWHLSLSVGAAACGLLGSAYFTGNPVMVVACLSVAAVGLYGSMPLVWTIPPTFLTGAAAAAGIATINSIGNLGGFAGPSIVGWIRDASGGFIYALIFLGITVLLGSFLAFYIGHKNDAEQTAVGIKSTDAVAHR